MPAPAKVSLDSEEVAVKVAETTVPSTIASQGVQTTIGVSFMDVVTE